MFIGEIAMNMRIRRVTIISFFIGAALIFAASYFELFFPPKNAFYLGILGDTLLAGIKSLGLAIITSTLVNILKNWMEPTESLVSNGFINRLTKSEMKELKSKLEAELYFRDNNHDKDNFYNFFEEELSSLLNDCYYKYYKTKIECKICENYITKTIRKKFEIVNPSKREAVIGIPFGAEMQKVEGIDNNKLYVIKKFAVDNEDYTKEINESLTVHERCADSNDAYCIDVYTSWDVKVKKTQTIDMVIETIVPLSDVCFSNKITKPCKEYNLIFLINDPSYQLSWHSFGFMGNHKDMLIEEPMDNGIEIGFKEWILPGDGVVISISKNEKNID